MKCKDCGAEIQFITHVSTYKKIPCETELKHGNSEITLVTIDGYLITKAGPNTRGYEPHWGNCSGAEKFRREKK